MVKREEARDLPRLQCILKQFSMEDKALLVGREIYIPLSCQHVLEPFASKDEALLVGG